MLKGVFVAVAFVVAAFQGSGLAQEAPSLGEIRKVFIEPMPNDLHQYISAEITKQLKDRLLVVLQKESADAILRGVSEQKTGTGAAITGRYLGLHDNANGSISLIDKNETVILWSAEAGDRSMWFGAMSRGGQRKVASRLVDDLKDALKKADGSPPRRVSSGSPTNQAPLRPTPPATLPSTAPPPPATAPATGSSSAPPPTVTPATGRVPAVEGFSQDQVLAALGKPSYQRDGSNGVTTWYYEINGETVRIFFVDNKASLKTPR